MKITLTHPDPERRIAAIKSIRAITGYGLKEAKEMGDDLLSAPAYTATVDLDLGALNEMRGPLKAPLTRKSVKEGFWHEGFRPIVHEAVEPSVTLDQLSAMPQDMRLADVLPVLRAVLA